MSRGGYTVSHYHQYGFALDHEQRWSSITSRQGAEAQRPAQGKIMPKKLTRIWDCSRTPMCQWGKHYFGLSTDLRMLQVPETSSQYSQTQFLNSPSQTTRQSPLEISPHSSRPRSEATPSPRTSLPQAPSISPHPSQINMPDTLVSPQAYRASFSQPTMSPHMARSQPPEQHPNGAEPTVRRPHPALSYRRLPN